MKIAWVTPFGRRSAIGRVSCAVVRELSSRGHEVLIIRSERDRADPSEIHASESPVSWWHDVSPREVERANDLIVLNFGDQYDFHAGTLSFVKDVICLGVFHDYYVYGFFNFSLADNIVGGGGYEHEIRLTYGDAVMPLVAEARLGNVSLEQVADAFPMTEWLGRRCGAALAHSRFYLHRLERSCPGPVAVAPLCFEGRDVRPLIARGERPTTVTTIGRINPNKCVDRLIEAIGSSLRLRASCRLRIVGAITDPERVRLQALCRQIGLDHVAIVGEVNDATLINELERADILSCLRNPVLEGASASAIEGMKCGRPIIVADAGFYSELPDDLVCKVPSSVEIRPLAAVLERLVADESLRQEIGRNARNWATSNFTTKNYVDVLEDLMNQFVQVKHLLALGGRLGRQLAMLEMEPDDPAIKKLSGQITEFFLGDL